MARTALSLFGGAPTDVLAKLDLYEKVPTELRTKFKSGFSAFSQELNNILTNNKISVSDILKDVGIPMTTEDAARRIGQVISGGSAFIESLSRDLKTNVLRDLTGPNSSIGNVLGNYGIRVNGETVTVKGVDISDMREVGKALAAYGGEELFELVDIESQSSYIRAMLEVVSLYGVGDLITDIIDNIDDDQVRWRTVSAASTTLSSFADLNTITSLLNSIGQEAMLASNPGFINQMLSGYTFRNGITPDLYETELAKMVNILDRVKPDWFYVEFGGEVRTNLATLSWCSDDAKTLFISDPEYRSEAMVATEYPTINKLTELKDMYPLAAFAS